MSIITKATETHRTETVTLEFIDKAVEMIYHGSNNFLIFTITLDDDVVFPKSLPKLVMVVFNDFGSGTGYFKKKSDSLVFWVLVMLG